MDLLNRGDELSRLLHGELERTEVYMLALLEDQLRASTHPHHTRSITCSGSISFISSLTTSPQFQIPNPKHPLNENVR